MSKCVTLEWMLEKFWAEENADDEKNEMIESLLLYLPILYYREWHSTTLVIEPQHLFIMKLDDQSRIHFRRRELFEKNGIFLNVCSMCIL